MFNSSRGASKSTGHSSLTASSPPPKQQQQQQPEQFWGRDFLPPGLVPASPSSPLPLFSPSQQCQAEEEIVLHSIFSPTFLVQEQRRRQKRHSPGGRHAKKGGRHHHHHVNSSSKANTGTTATATTTTPQNHQHTNYHERHQRPTPASLPRSLYMTSNNILFSPLEISYSPAQQTTTSRSSSLGWRHAGDGDYDNDNDWYSAMTASACRQLSCGLQSSWKTYSLEHICQCHDAQELQHIMKQLQAETTPCPSLLRAAQERLKTISLAATNMPPPPPPLNEPSDAHKNRDSTPGVVVHITSPSAQTATSSSLVYSDDGSQFPLEQQQMGAASRGPDHNNNNKHVSSTSSLVKVRSNCEQHELQAQVGRLKDTIVELDQRHAQEQETFLKRLQDLRLAESRTGEKIQQLQKDLSSSQLSNKELLESLEDMEEDVKTLRLQYQAEQTARTKQAMQHKQVEARLTTRIQQLVQQLDEHQKALAAAEDTKKEDPVMQQKLAQLNVEVRSLKRQLESVRKERNAMLRAMIDATGRNVNDIKQMAGHDRRCLIADFAKSSAASKSAFDAMTKALILSEMERRQSIECQRKMEGQMKERVHVNARLEENSFQQIQQLTEELAASRAHVDELLHSEHAQQQKDYQEREVLYQRTIRSLKKQICSQGSMVPARDYKSAVAEATRLSRAVAHLEQEILHQKEYYHHQQQKLQRSQQQQPWQQVQQEMGRVDSQCSSSKENRQPLRAVIVADTTGTENTAPNITVNNNHNNDKHVSIKSPPPPPGGETKSKDGTSFLSPPPSSSKPKSKRRQEVVRQHGGRKGLQERIQTVRAPSIAATSNKRE